MEQNKTSKYFKYAIGEIVLVVIGILIAVAINGRYQASQNQQNIETILKQIQSDLSTDIIDAHRIYDFFIHKDSMAKDILYNKITLEDAIKNLEYSNLGRSYVSFSNNRSGYSRLVNNIEILPKKFLPLLPDLNLLYVEYQNDIDDYNTSIKNVVRDYSEGQSTSIPEYSNWFINKDSVGRAQHYFNDPLYKNWVIRYLNNLSNLVEASSFYRVKALEVYLKIDSLLEVPSNNIPEHLYPVGNNPDQIKSYVGTYIGLNTDRTLKIEYLNNELYFIGKQVKFKMWHHRDNIFFRKNTGTQSYYKFEENNGTLKLYATREGHENPLIWKKNKLRDD